MAHTPLQGQSNDFGEFLGRLKIYAENHQYTWSMPVVKPDTGQADMPPLTLRGTEDPVSGKIYDPETGYAFNTRSGEISREESSDT